MAQQVPQLLTIDNGLVTAGFGLAIVDPFKVATGIVSLDDLLMYDWQKDDSITDLARAYNGSLKANQGARRVTPVGIKRLQVLTFLHRHKTTMGLPVLDTDWTATTMSDHMEQMTACMDRKKNAPTDPKLDKISTGVGLTTGGRRH